MDTLIIFADNGLNKIKIVARTQENVRNFYVMSYLADQSTSLLELCEKEEWEVICRLIPTMFHLWNFEEKKCPRKLCTDNLLS